MSRLADRPALIGDASSRGAETEIRSDDDLRQIVRRLRGVHSTSSPVLSLYLNLAPERFDRSFVGSTVNSLLGPVRELVGSGELGHAGAASLKADIERCLDLVPQLEANPKAAAAVFLCDEMGLVDVVDLPRPVWDCAVTGPSPYVRPVEGVLDEFRKIAAVVLDSRHAEIVVSYMGETLDHQRVDAEELRKSNLAGWYGLDEYRNRHHAEEARHHLYREVAGRLDLLRRESGVEVVFVGGHKDATDALLPFLVPRVREMTETFVIDVHTLTPATLASTLAGLEAEYERNEEERIVEEIYVRAAAGDLGAIGMGPVLRAANRHAIARLIVHDGVSMPGAVCTSCAAMTLPTARCPVCGAGTTPIPDLIESLVRVVIEGGGSVEHVMTETRLREDIVAADLRF